MFKLTVLLGLVFLVGCKPNSELVIDGTTQETYEKSIASMRNALPETDRDVFARGLMRLILTSHPGHDPNATPLQALALIPAAVKNAPQTLDGTPLDAIMKVGREIADKQIKADAQKLAFAAADKKIRECLATKIILSNAKVVRGRYSSQQLVFEIKNNIGFAIAGIRFRYTVKSPSRAVPWKTDTIALSIAGGVEPGETKFSGVDLYGLPSGAFLGTIVTMELLDIADAQSRMLIGRTRVIGWPNEPSSATCPPTPT